MKLFYVELIHLRDHFYLRANNRDEIVKVLEKKKLEEPDYHIEEIKPVGLATFKRTATRSLRRPRFQGQL
jgi:hypothetical protein